MTSLNHSNDDLRKDLGTPSFLSIIKNDHGKTSFGMAGAILVGLIILGLIGHVGVAATIIQFFEEKISWEKTQSSLKEDLSEKKQQLQKVQDILGQKAPAAQEFEAKLADLSSQIASKKTELSKLDDAVSKAIQERRQAELEVQVGSDKLQKLFSEYQQIENKMKARQDELVQTDKTIAA